jgi:hypothetical protein
MTFTAATDKSGKIGRIYSSSQPAIVSDKPANRARMLCEVRLPDAVIVLEYRGKLHRMHRDQAWHCSFGHRVPPPPLVG